ncbi:MAG: hypothetical protein COA43_14675 [Robiginitomaculum sp.]|nr:MAG: hypothetical protein COA43_14675 [Robiginitomaculum sp.]
MKDVTVTNNTIQDYFEELIKEIDEHGVVICSSQPADTGKWGMAKLWRMWMSATAKFMAKNGVTMPLMINADGVTYSSRPFNAEDAHELFTRQHLGVDESGTRLSWAKSGAQRKATKGERFNALRKHEEWSSERGIILFKPRKSEYQELTDKQND